METFIRTKDKVDGELFVRYIFGLGIFDINKVKRGHKLEVEFLRLLSQESLLSAHMRMSPDFAHSPLELFGPPREDAYYEPVSVGPGAGTGDFYRTLEWPDSVPCFFPEVTESFWNVIVPETHETWGKILYYDAVVFYADPIYGDYLSRMNALFANDAKTSGKWMEEVLSIYRLAIISAGDMNFFKVYAKNVADFDILSKSIQRIENIVNADSWYRQNKDNLVWDGEKGMGLRLKPF